jgi:hypothetical protein
VWSNYFYEPSVALYFYDDESGQYVLEDTPSPYVDYFVAATGIYCSDDQQETPTFVKYEPVAIAWTDYYEEPNVDLYSYNPQENDYEVESEPTPGFTYYFWSEPTQSYSVYEPVTPDWN